MKKCKRVHHKKEPYDVFIGRPSKWSNPYSHKVKSSAKYKTNSRKESILKYKEWLTNGDGIYLLDDLRELKGKTLGCWCDKGKSCHGDVLVELVNNLDRKGLEVLWK